MSQSALRPAKEGEEFEVRLRDERGDACTFGKGRTEREAADAAEREWRRRHGSYRPTEKTVRVQQASAVKASS